MAPLVSLCMIVKNEEANLPLCLGTVAELVQEIVIVDTGSSDQTKPLAAQFDARVIDFAWCDDFAAARNESLRHATGQWIFWLDADDRVDTDNRLRLRNLLASLPDDNRGYLMEYRSLKDFNCGGQSSSVARVALFRSHANVRWQYRVHEQIQASVEQNGARLERTNIVIDTVGHQQADVVRAKLERNYRLLLLENAEHPGDPITLWNLGRTALRSDHVAEAADWLRRTLATGAVFEDRIQALIYGQLAEALCRLRRFHEALPVCQEGRGRFPQDIALLLAEGVVLAELGAPNEAAMRLYEVLQRDPGNGMARAWLAKLQIR
jgi:glycosyltransferase involved in cell wall biosynthesis